MPCTRPSNLDLTKQTTYHSVPSSSIPHRHYYGHICSMIHICSSFGLVYTWSRIGWELSKARRRGSGVEHLWGRSRTPGVARVEHLWGRGCAPRVAGVEHLRGRSCTPRVPKRDNIFNYQSVSRGSSTILMKGHRESSSLWTKLLLRSFLPFIQTILHDLS